jgi:hypothetical protein
MLAERTPPGKAPQPERAIKCAARRPTSLWNGGTIGIPLHFVLTGRGASGKQQRLKASSEKGVSTQ